MVAALLSVLLFHYHAQSRSSMISLGQIFAGSPLQMYFDETIGVRFDQNKWEHEIVMAGDENWVDIGSPDEFFRAATRRRPQGARHLD
jgi:hypothetical protein